MSELSFKLVISRSWRRRDDEDPITSEIGTPRPHVIGLTDNARKFLREQRYVPIKYFSPFYTGGGGSCLYEGRWEPSLRFVSIEQEGFDEKRLLELMEQHMKLHLLRMSVAEMLQEFDDEQRASFDAAVSGLDLSDYVVNMPKEKS